MRAPIWKIQVTQSSNSNSCCKNGQVPLELFSEVHFKGPHVALRSIFKLRKQCSNFLFGGKKTPVVFNMWPQALHKEQTTTFCCFIRRNDLSFTQTIKLVNGPNPAFQHPRVMGHSVLQQNTEAVQPWTSLSYATGELLGLCFSVTFVTALFILGKLWSIQNYNKDNWAILGGKVLKLLLV